MSRFADPMACPDCAGRLPIDVDSCPSCGLVLRGSLANELIRTLRTADDLLAQLRLASAPATGIAHTPYPASAQGAPTATRLPRSDGPSGMSTLSVPKILLGLGALCLLVAAVIFLAVAWSWLGVGGRTAVLVGLTLLSGGLGVWLGRRELRVAAESLVTVALGLVALDVVGADNAGWLGDLSNAGQLSATSAGVLVVALLLSLTTGLVAPQVVTALAMSGLALGLAGQTDHLTTVLTAAVLAHAVLVGIGHLARFRGRLQVLQVAAVVGATSWWCALLLTGLVDAINEPSLQALWLEGHGAGLLIASLLPLLPVPFARARRLVVRGLLAGSASLLTLLAGIPVIDATASQIWYVVLAALVVWALVAIATPAAWRLVPRVPMLLAAVPLVALALTLAWVALVTSVGSREPFSAGAGVRLDDPPPTPSPVLLLLAVAGLLLAVVAVRPRASLRGWQVAASLLALAAIGTLALHAVPVWSVMAALALLGAVLGADGLSRSRPAGAVEVVTGLGTALLALLVALPSAVLTTVAAAVLVLLAAASVRLAQRSEVRVVGGLVLPVATGILLWTVGEVVGLDPGYRALPVLVVVGVLAIVLARPEIECAAAATGLIATLVAVPEADRWATSLAVHLTLGGMLVTASALVHRDRRVLGWLGGLLLAGATWVRLADLGVTAPEPYTLPSAAVLLLLAIHRLRTDPAASTVQTLTPGLLLATVPSLLWVLVDPVSWRAIALGAGCLALVLAGASRRWNAPLLVGGAVGAVLVLRELAPYAAVTPQWVLIGLAGTCLTVVGITWERRVRDVQHAATYLGRLR